MKLRVAHKLLLACLISVAAALGLAIWLIVAQAGSLPGGFVITLAFLLSLGLALVVVALAEAWATGDRQSINPDSPSALPTLTVGNTNAWRQAELELAGTLDSAELAGAITRHAQALLGVASAHLYEVDQPRRKLQLLYSAGLDLPAQRAFDTSAAGRAAEGGLLVVEALPSGDLMGLPLRWRDKLVGVLELRGLASIRSASIRLASMRLARQPLAGRLPK